LSYWPTLARSEGFDPRTHLVSRCAVCFRQKWAELAHLDALGSLLLVLRRAVVAPLALGARQRHDVSHCGTPGRRSAEGPAAPGDRRSPGPTAALLDDLRDGSGTHRAATLADGEARALLDRDRVISSAEMVVLSPASPFRRLREVQRAGHIGRPDVELRSVAVEDGVWRRLFLRQDVDRAVNLVCGVIEPAWRAPGRARVVFSTPRSSTPMLSPATPASSACGTSRRPSPPSSASPQSRRSRLPRRP